MKKQQEYMRLLSEIKTELLDLIKRSGEVSTDVAARQLKLSKTTVRQHFLMLERQGLIERHPIRTARGRPRLVYRITESGERIYPSSDASLFREFLLFLQSGGHEDTIRLFFEASWKKRLERFEYRLSEAKDDSLETRIEILTALLEQDGFMPMIERKNTKCVVLRECNCPFSSVVQATTLPCELEAEFIQTALKNPAVRRTHIPQGSSICSYEITALLSKVNESRCRRREKRHS